MSEIVVRIVKSGEELFKYEVEIRQSGSASLHGVTVEREDYEKLTAGGRVSPEVLVEKSFEFLLEREPKESILKTFKLNIISHYFREYPGKIKDYF
jgi:hypothetical protein